MRRFAHFLGKTGPLAAALSLAACGGGEDPGNTGETGSDSSDANTDDGSEGSESSCQVGTEGCPCTLDGICEQGLTCQEGVCVAADATCGDGTLDPGEECDQGANNDNEGICKEDCTLQVCGDGYVGPGEACDDGNTVDDDECTDECVLASCGDGIVQEGEACDDGNMNEQDGCTSLCLEPQCGDGFLHEGEDCDDGNTDETDGCASDCTYAPLCGDGITAVNEVCYEDEKLISVSGITDIALADLDGDGNIDIVATLGALAGFQVFPGLGGGDFGEPVSVPSFEAGAQTGTSVGSVTVGDYNGDAQLDIAVALTSNENGGEIIYQEGTGVIADYASAALRRKVGMPMGAGTLDTWDNPSGPDTIFNSTLTATCLGVSSYNYEPGTQNPSEYYYSQRGEFCEDARTVVFGDFDGDSDHADDAIGIIYKFFTHQSAVEEWTTPLGGSLPTSMVDLDFQDINPGTAATAMTDGVVGDFNGDGYDDLAVTNWDAVACNYAQNITACEGDQLAVLFGDSSEVTVYSEFLVDLKSEDEMQVGKAPIASATADVDLDGDLDLIVAYFFDARVTVLFNDGEGKFTAAEDSPQLVDLVSLEVAVAELNGDGVPDLVLAQGYTESVSILLSNP